MYSKLRQYPFTFDELTSFKAVDPSTWVPNGERFGEIEIFLARRNIGKAGCQIGILMYYCSTPHRDSPHLKHTTPGT
jgi:hypothetical protein